MVLPLEQSLRLTASAVCLCLPQLCQSGKEEQDMNLAKHLKEEHCQQVEGASNDNPQGSQVGAAEGALASDPCTRVTRAWPARTRLRDGAHPGQGVW